MTMEERIAAKDNLMQRIRVAAATMDKKETLFQLRHELEELQETCPHFDAKLNFVMVDDKCPYCGKNIGR